MPAMILILGAQPLGTQRLLPWVQGSWVCKLLYTAVMLAVTNHAVISFVYPAIGYACSDFALACTAVGTLTMIYI